jgi:hypothetical protein
MTGCNPERIETMINSLSSGGRDSKLGIRQHLTAVTRRSGRSRKAACQFRANVLPLEDRCLMAHLEMPLAPAGSFGRYDTVGSLSDVLFVGNSTLGTAPTKQMTLYNNTDQTVYPFLYDPNTGESTAGGYYDPEDEYNQEYRGYIGYSENGKDYLGLQAHHSITINVPFVFWDSGRGAIATDPKLFLPEDKNTSKSSPATNPFFFFYKNNNGSDTARYVVPAAQSSGGNGLVMYYHCVDPAVNPGADAPEQLIEFTIRDKAFLSKINTPTNPITPDQITTLINYDVSYVDDLLVPAAMAATGVPIPNTTESADYGWIGAQDSYRGADSLQAAIKKFTNVGPSNGLGTYFEYHGERLGWPTFYNPHYASDPGVGLRVPSGAGVLLDSPLAGIASTYDPRRWMLSSGGDKPVKYDLGGKFYTPNKAVLSEVPGLDHILAALEPGKTTVTADNISIGKVKSVDIKTRTVYLTQNPNLGNDTGQSYVFANPPSDPFTTKITNLWYSWAKYYQDQFKTFQPEQLTANVSSDRDNNGSDYRILTFTSGHPELAVGMQVSGGGVSALTTIMKIVTTNGVTQYFLSRPVPGVNAPTQITFKFSAPPGIAFNAQTANIPLKFSTPEQQTYAKEFAADVYELLSVFSTARIQDANLPSSMGIVENVIGGNVGFLPTADPIDYVNISADVRDIIKSALRGVPDFTMAPESKWYPAPSLPTGGQTYNVFNLDPYVWFVHQELKLSGYGFSFDDDTADVNADGTSTISVAIGGLNGLSNKSEWVASTPWGEVSSLATISQGTGQLAGKSIISLQSKAVYNQLKADDPKNSLVGAYVSGPNILAGTNLLATAIISENQFVLSQNAPSTTTPVLLKFSGRLPR